MAGKKPTGVSIFQPIYAQLNICGVNYSVCRRADKLLSILVFKAFEHRRNSVNIVLAIEWIIAE